MKLPQRDLAGLQPAGDDRYEMDLGVAVAAIAGNFKGIVALEQGFVKGHALVTLTPDNDRTEVHVAAHADAGGMIARLCS